MSKRWAAGVPAFEGCYLTRRRGDAEKHAEIIRLRNECGSLACGLHCGTKGPNIELWGYPTPPLARGAHEQ